MELTSTFGVFIAVINQLITVDSVLIMVLTIGMTEFIKQGFKHYKNVKSLDDWTIRGISMIFGVFFSLAVLSVTVKLRLLYGLFYAFIAPILYLVGKRIIIDKYFPKVGEMVSGQ